MSIGNWARFQESIWDWNVLDGCFGLSSISPMDVDGLAEAGGRFLVLETKAPTAELSGGQRRALEALANTGLFTVIIVWGQKNQPQRIAVWTRQREYVYDPADLRTLKNIVSWWYEGAAGREAA